MRTFSFLNPLLVETKSKNPSDGQKLRNSSQKDFFLFIRSEIAKHKTSKGFYKGDKLNKSIKNTKFFLKNLNSKEFTLQSLGRHLSKNKLLKQLRSKNFQIKNFNIKEIKHKKLVVYIPSKEKITNTKISMLFKEKQTSLHKVMDENSLLKNLAEKINKNKLLLKKERILKQFKELKLNKPLKAKKQKLKELPYYAILSIYYNKKLLNPSIEEEIISQNQNNFQNKKALFHYKNENSSFLTKLIPLKGKEKEHTSSENGNFFNLQFQDGGKFLTELKDKFHQKKVFKSTGAEYNKIKKVFSLKIPLDEQTILKITSVKNNFYAQITTSAERVNLLIQNLQTLTQQIASLGFSSTVIKIQTSSGSSSNANFNGKGQSNGGNNKDKNVSNNRWKVENNNSSYTSFSFYL